MNSDLATRLLLGLPPTLSELVIWRLQVLTLKLIIPKHQQASTAHTNPTIFNRTISLSFIHPIWIWMYLRLAMLLNLHSLKSLSAAPFQVFIYTKGDNKSAVYMKCQVLHNSFILCLSHSLSTCHSTTSVFTTLQWWKVNKLGKVTAPILWMILCGKVQQTRLDGELL